MAAGDRQRGADGIPNARWRSAKTASATVEEAGNARSAKMSAQNGVAAAEQSHHSLARCPPAPVSHARLWKGSPDGVMSDICLMRPEIAMTARTATREVYRGADKSARAAGIRTEMAVSAVNVGASAWSACSTTATASSRATCSVCAYGARSATSSASGVAQPAARGSADAVRPAPFPRLRAARVSTAHARYLDRLAAVSQAQA